MTPANNDPVPASNFQPVEFQGATDPVSFSRPILRIDHGAGEKSIRPGSLIYCGVPIAEAQIVFATSRMFRTMFAATYNQNPNAPMTCASWDGINAYGYGGRSITQLKERNCEQCEWSSTRDSDKWCRPQMFYFGMLTHAESDVLMPFFFEARGMAVGGFADAFKAARASSMTTAVKQSDGSIRVAKPIYAFRTPVRLEKVKGKTAYEPRFGAPTMLSDDDLAWVHTYMSSQGKETWLAELEHNKTRAREIGKPKEARGDRDEDVEAKVPF